QFGVVERLVLSAGGILDDGHLLLEVPLHLHILLLLTNVKLLKTDAQLTLNFCSAISRAFLGFICFFSMASSCSLRRRASSMCWC
ncbi:unnamed protein product, partial [Ixodes pacificus]